MSSRPMRQVADCPPLARLPFHSQADRREPKKEGPVSGPLSLQLKRLLLAAGMNHDRTTADHLLGVRTGLEVVVDQRTGVVVVVDLDAERVA
jgi:hypothetical protein